MDNKMLFYVYLQVEALTKQSHNHEDEKVLHIQQEASLTQMPPSDQSVTDEVK